MAAEEQRQETGSARAVLYGFFRPSPWHLLRFLCGATSYLLFTSLAFVVVAKFRALARLEGVDESFLTFLGLVDSDTLLHLGLACLFALGEARDRRLLFITFPLALALACLASINALYLGIAGEQLTWEAFSVGLDHFGEVTEILSESGISLFRAILGALFFAAIPVGLFVLLRRKGPDSNFRVDALGRAQLAAVAALPAVLVFLLASPPRSLAVQALDGNASIATYSAWAKGAVVDAPELPPERFFTGYVPERLAPSSFSAQLSRRERPNILVLVLESVRWDATGLAGEEGWAQTPNLNALAERGTQALFARAVVPHTSKSLFSILCGRFPLLQRRNYEVAGNIPVQCLGGLLEEAGYITGFAQTALGAFEERPRLVERLGFQSFGAWEELQGAPSGYLGSDDESLSAAFVELLEQKDEERPFYITLLTSATHHPYRLSGAAKERVKESAAPAKKARERYARLIEAEDHLLGELLGELEKRGLSDSTIVLVVGDHGEGFGAKGVQQHDNNFYEEGLRVPFVLAGPGVPKKVIKGNVSLVDIVPTLLDLLMGEVRGDRLGGLSIPGLPGMSIYNPSLANTPRPFACYFDGYCYGYVLGNHKVLFLKDSTKALYFDLATDPGELKARPLNEAMKASHEQLFELVDKRRTPSLERVLAPLTRIYGEWSCPAGERCTHPNNPDGFFFDM